MRLATRFTVLLGLVALVVASVAVMYDVQRDAIDQDLRDVRFSQEQLDQIIAYDREIDTYVFLRSNDSDPATLEDALLRARHALGDLTDSIEREGAAEHSRLQSVIAYQRALEDGNIRATEHIVRELDLMLRAEQHEIRAASEELTQRSALKGVASVVVALVVLLGMWLIVLPLRHATRALIASTRRIADGDLTTPAQYKGPGDIEELAGAIDSMRIQLAERLENLEVTRASLQASERRYRTLFDLSPLPMWVSDRATLQFIAVNDALVALSGVPRETLLTMSLRDVSSLDEKAETIRTLSDHRSREVVRIGVKKLVRADGSCAYVDMACHLIEVGDSPAFLMVGNDVTEARKIEAHLRQAQKMEAIGQLAGGVAHDFNNLLGAVQLNVDAVADTLGPDHALSEDLAEIAKIVDGGARLTRQLLAFSREAKTERVPMNLNATVTNLSRMCSRLLGENIDLTLELDGALGAIEADRGHIEQVLINLVLNARDAMPSGGRIVIRTTNVQLDQATASGLGLSAGRYVEMSCKDNGCGMSEATKARIFEPFFTTKGVGKGTGLGLATVFGIVTGSEGAIGVDSAVGHGTTMRLYFPYRRPTTSDEIAPVRKGQRGSETVMLVEDDDQLRSIARRFLHSWGYNCHAFPNADLALEVLREGEHIDLLLTDIGLPGIDGRALADQVRRLRPSAKILMMSGYPDLPAVRTAAAADESFVQKPFTATSLAEAIRGALGN